MANNQPVLGSSGWTVDEGAKQVWYDTRGGLVDQGGVALPGLQGLQSLVSTPGNQPSATLAATVGTAGQVVRLSDGPDAGALLVWAIPQGASAYAWCWWLWPQAAY